jgi:hypothetical protein
VSIAKDKKLREQGLSLNRQELIALGMPVSGPHSLVHSMRPNSKIKHTSKNVVLVVVSIQESQPVDAILLVGLECGFDVYRIGPVPCQRMKEV